MIRKLYRNFLNSINGLKITLKENSFILELIGGVFLIPYIIFIDISLLIKLLIFTVYFLLLAFEILNTSIEKLCDKIFFLCRRRRANMQHPFAYDEEDLNNFENNDSINKINRINHNV